MNEERNEQNADVSEQKPDASDQERTAMRGAAADARTSREEAPRSDGRRQRRGSGGQTAGHREEQGQIPEGDHVVAENVRRSRKPLVAEPSGIFSGTLHVLAFNYDGSEGDGVWQDGYTPRPGVAVSVASAELEDLIGRGFHDTESTDEDGNVEFTGLPAGRYTVVVVGRQDSSPKYYVVDGSGRSSGDAARDGIDVVVDDAGEAWVQIGFVPAQVTLTVRAYHDAARTGNAANQQPINGVSVAAFRDRQRLGGDLTAVDGSAEFTISRLGVVAVRAPATIRVGGRLLHLALQGPLHVPVGPDGDNEVELPYVTGLGELRVEASFVQTGNGREERVPFEGVTLRLYRGNAAGGTGFTEARTDALGWASFYDLDDGYYTVMAVPPSRFKGTAVEMYRPDGGSSPVMVRGGGMTALADAFAFRPRTGVITGIVTDAGTDQGVAGAPIVVTSSSDGDVRQTVTDTKGGFLVDGLPFGVYTVGFARAKFTSIDNRPWEAAPGDASARTVTVSAAAPAAQAALTVTREEHVVHLHASGPDGQALAHAVVDVFDGGSQPIATVTLDGDGYYAWNAPRAGNYSFAVVPVLGQPAQRFPVSVHSHEHLFMKVAGGQQIFGPPAPPPPPQNGNGNGVAHALDDLTAYPLLTDSINLAPYQPTVGGGGGGGLSVTQRVEGAIRDVLGWRPKPGDTRGYLAALGQAFTPTEVEGRTVWAWTPRSYAVQADMGKVTGAQASIFARAQAALDQSLPLLEGLEPLDPAADTDNTEAVRSVVRSDFSELVHELGEEGGPRVARVDALFEALLGPGLTASSVINPEQVGGQLGDLSRRFGLSRRRVNTVDEEQNLTNFLIIVDHVRSLQQSWIVNRPFFDGSPGTEPFFGTQLVLVSRALAVVAESVQEVFFTMDSVFMRSAERQTTELTYPDDAPIFVEGLLNWVERFAAEEGPRLIQEGGKLGARSAVPTLCRLTKLVQGALIPPQSPAALPPGYRTARVQRALQELAEHLQDATDLTNRLLEPDGAAPALGGGPPVMTDAQVQSLAQQVARALGLAAPGIR